MSVYGLPVVVLRIKVNDASRDLGATNFSLRNGEMMVHSTKEKRLISSVEPHSLLNHHHEEMSRKFASLLASPFRRTSNESFFFCRGHWKTINCCLNLTKPLLLIQWISEILLPVALELFFSENK